MTKFILFLLFNLNISILAYASSAPWENKEWKKLLHVDRQATNTFYISKMDPSNKEILKSEWDASVKAFMSEDNIDKNIHPQCIFPARYLYLKKHSKFPFKDSKCPDYDSWIQSLSPVGASLVFAGNFPENPGSSFGHTFLKITTSAKSRLQLSKSPPPFHLEMLDYAINYAANSVDPLGPSFAIKGIFGGYYGIFSLDPYYMKLKDYSESEGRDIWEYKLNLSEDEARFLVAHFWELKVNALFNYYFFTENCSYLILVLLDIAKPEWKIIEDASFYTLPLETVKQIKKIPDAVLSINYRPSIRKKANNAYKLLSLEQQNLVSDITSKKIAPLSVTDTRVLVTEALLLQSKKSLNDGKLDSNENEIYFQVLSQLALLPSQATDWFESNISMGPELSHAPRQFSIDLGKNSKPYFDMGLRLAVHDMMDFGLGFLDYSEFIIGDFQIRTTEESVKLKELSPLEVALFRPINVHAKPLSWRMKMKYQNDSILLSKDAKSIYGEVVGGFSHQTTSSILSYFVMGPFVENPLYNNTKLNFGIIAELGVFYESVSHTKIWGLVEFYENLRRNNLNSYSWSPTVKFTHHFNTNWDFNIKSKWLRENQYSQTLIPDFDIGLDIHF